jgi:hypothetical protein
MIGNKIQFSYYIDNDVNKWPEIKQGIVVDAFIMITGEENSLNMHNIQEGIGEKIKNTFSKRVYKVEFFHDWDTGRTEPSYKNIFEWQLKKIISFANEIRR